MSDEARLWTELGRLGEDPLPGERSDVELVAAALAGLAQAPATLADAAPSRPRVGSRVGIGVGLVAVAAAVLLGWWLRPATGLVTERAAGSGSLAPSLADDDPAGGRAIAGRDPREGTPLGKADSAPTATTPDSDAGAAVSASAVTLAEEPDASPKPAIARRSTAPALLEQAQRLVSKGERVAAVAAYERLIDRFPESREAAAGLVSLGRLELDRGRASQALARFDAYLAGSAGALVEEARYGRIRALRQLGRLEQELRSIEAFLADHPGSLYAARLRKRAEELRAP